MPPKRFGRPAPQGGSYTGPWPSDTQLQKMGLSRCQGENCTVWLDPANTRNARFCSSHRSRKPSQEKS